MLPLRPSTVDELHWYFEQTRLSSRCLDQRFCNARAAFSTPRFRAVYKRWKEDGNAALANVGSNAIRKAVEAGNGRIEVLELGHRYGHLSPLAAVA